VCGEFNQVFVSLINALVSVITCLVSEFNHVSECYHVFGEFNHACMMLSGVL
jgi:hypothetical protein